MCDCDESRAQGNARRCKCPAFSDYRALLRARPDLAVVLLPHDLHADVTIDALEAGCHVLVEKPMATQVGSDPRGSSIIGAAEAACSPMSDCIAWRSFAALSSLQPSSVFACVQPLEHVPVEACTTALARYRDSASVVYEEVGYFPTSLSAHLTFEAGVVGWDEHC